MCPQKPRRLSQARRLSPDTGPIVFPAPTSVPKADESLSQPDDSGDIIIDPHGNCYCFVCKVSVPRGSSNISQHLGGKKHDNNNKRFKTPAEKAQLRSRVILAAQQQRNQIPKSSAQDTPPNPAPNQAEPPQSSNSDAAEKSRIQTKTPSVALPAPSRSSSPEAADTRILTRGALEKRKKDARRSEAKRLRSILIDKNSFLTTIVGDGNDTESSTASSDRDDDSQSAALEYPEDRQKPFGPLSFKPPEGPDYFFDSMAEETELSKDAAKLRQILSHASVKRPQQVDESITDMEPGETLSDDAAPADAEGFLTLSNKRSKEDEKEQLEAVKEEAKKARDSLSVLKDFNGEELPPWLISAKATENVLYTSDSSIALHYEILEFSRFVSPTRPELASRSEMVLMVESIVKQLWPSSDAHVFGSYATGLYLPTSDIDICVLKTPQNGKIEEFTQLAEAIRNVSGFARRVNVIKAKIPLVKIIARKDGMNCDISIGVENGLKNVPVIKQYLKSYPALRPLLMVIKCFLQQRDLNEVYSGGLGSYTILLLVVSHLQMLRYNFPTSKTNLGAVLQQFLQFYGRTFNICTTGIRVKDKGCYFDKFEKYQTTPHETIRYCVEDPNDETNELGRNGYGALRVRKAFFNASRTLINWRRDNAATSPTPLGSIIQSDESFLRRRSSVLADCERNGTKILRDSVEEANESANGEGSKLLDTGVVEDVNRGMKNRGAGEHPDRIRDPRLIKRRRGNPRTNFNHSTMTKEGGYDARPVVMTEASYAAPLAQGNYDPMIFYGQAQPTYPGQPYPASTPGYEYPIQQAVYPRNGVAMPERLYGNTYPPQQMVPQSTQRASNYSEGYNHSPDEANRRRRKRRYPRRGGSASRGR